MISPWFNDISMIQWYLHDLMISLYFILYQNSRLYDYFFYYIMGIFLYMEIIRYIKIDWFSNFLSLELNIYSPSLKNQMELELESDIRDRIYHFSMGFSENQVWFDFYWGIYGFNQNHRLSWKK